MEKETNRPKTTPKDFFLHVGTVVTMYMTVVALLVLLFNVIDYAYPDALRMNDYYYNSYNPYSEAVRWSVAMLVVVFPVFWLLSWVLNRDYAADPLKKAVAVRKWLAYLTLFAAGLAMMIDLIVLINTFLGGEITTRFILKVLSVFAVAGLVFGYYVQDMRKYPTGPSKSLKLYMMVAAALILVSIASGFGVMGSPNRQRNLQFDQRKVNDLMNIQSQIIYGYWQRKGEVPNTLADLQDPISNSVIPNDPQSGQPYEYWKTGPRSFEICANFNYESQNGNNGPFLRGDSAAESMPPERYNENWNHGKGRHCFSRTIDPQLYPVYDQYGRQKNILPVPTAGTSTVIDSASADQATMDAAVRRKAAASGNGGAPQQGASCGPDGLCDDPASGI